MPSYVMFTKDFAKAILLEQKSLLKAADVKNVNIPKYDELSVKALYSELVQLDGV